jgi:hypothetical protein
VFLLSIDRAVRIIVSKLLLDCGQCLYLGLSRSTISISSILDWKASGEGPYTFSHFFSSFFLFHAGVDVWFEPLNLSFVDFVDVMLCVKPRLMGIFLAFGSNDILWTRAFPHGGTWMARTSSGNIKLWRPLSNVAPHQIRVGSVHLI